MIRANKNVHSDIEISNSFCVDMEEWFHITSKHSYSNPVTWKAAEIHVVKDTEKLLNIFSKHGIKVTFLVLGWIAKQYPHLIKKISDLGHEIGCHGFYHRFVHGLTPDEFELDVRVTLDLLRKTINKPVKIFRAPSFSIRKDCFWSFSILSKLGVKFDVSVVPALRNQGGVVGFPRDPFVLETTNGNITIIPVTVMEVANTTFQFSGGGFLRFFPKSLIDYGFTQNHRVGRQVMSFIHPREINPNHPKLKLPLSSYIRCYNGINTVEKKLNHLFETYKFTTISEAYKDIIDLPRYYLNEFNEICIIE